MERKTGLMPFFSLNELWCKCATCEFAPGKSWDSFSLEVLWRLHQVRIFPTVGEIIVTSGARCLAHHEAIYRKKGSAAPKESAHLIHPEHGCRGVDIRSSRLSSVDLAEIMAYSGFRGIGIADSYVHGDVLDRRAWWKYDAAGNQKPIFP